MSPQTPLALKASQFAHSTLGTRQGSSPELLGLMAGWLAGYEAGRNDAARFDDRCKCVEIDAGGPVGFDTSHCAVHGEGA